MFPGNVNYWWVSTKKWIIAPKILRFDGIYRGDETIEMREARNRFEDIVARREVKLLKKVKA